jgi:hypothetical protein
LGMRIRGVRWLGEGRMFHVGNAETVRFLCS